MSATHRLPSFLQYWYFLLNLFLLYRYFLRKKTQVSDLVEIKAGDGTQVGRHLCNAAGTLVLRWDNTSSMLRSKTVALSVKTEATKQA
jgi:hypothetical protein